MVESGWIVDKNLFCALSTACPTYHSLDCCLIVLVMKALDDLRLSHLTFRRKRMGPICTPNDAVRISLDERLRKQI